MLRVAIDLLGVCRALHMSRFLKRRAVCSSCTTPFSLSSLCYDMYHCYSTRSICSSVYCNNRPMDPTLMRPSTSLPKSSWKRIHFVSNRLYMPTSCLNSKWILTTNSGIGVFYNFVLGYLHLDALCASSKMCASLEHR